MSKWMVRLSSILLAIGLLVGCTLPEDNLQENEVQNNQVENNDQAAENEEVVSIVIRTDDGEEVLAEDEFAIEEGAILMDVLKEHFTIEEDGGFVTSIEGEEQDADEGKFWLYTVNGEEAMVGAHEYELAADDEVIFELSTME